MLASGRLSLLPLFLCKTFRSALTSLTKQQLSHTVSLFLTMSTLSSTDAIHTSYTAYPPHNNTGSVDDKDSKSIVTGTAPSSAFNLVGQEDAINIDKELFKSFSVDSLMELAGLSVAEATFKAFPPKSFENILVVAGPGNNGGDGLVAARHLVHFGYQNLTIFYPKPNQKPLLQNLVKQNIALGVQVLTEPDYNPGNLEENFDLVIDAVFGFSFRGIPREPFVNILNIMKDTTVPILSVDVPSGWHIEKGPTAAANWYPDALVSLTAPKLCTRFFNTGRHFLGGRFVPPDIGARYNITQPPYHATDQCVELIITESSSSAKSPDETFKSDL